MSRVDKYIELLKEFDYKKNGIKASISFLKLIIELFDDTFDYEWEVGKNE